MVSTMCWLDPWDNSHVAASRRCKARFSAMAIRLAVTSVGRNGRNGPSRTGCGPWLWPRRQVPCRTERDTEWAPTRGMTSASMRSSRGANECTSASSPNTIRRACSAISERRCSSSNRPSMTSAICVDVRLDEVRAGDQRLATFRRLGDHDAAVRHRLDGASPFEVRRMDSGGIGDCRPITVDVEQQLRRGQQAGTSRRRTPSAASTRRSADRPRSSGCRRGATRDAKPVRPERAPRRSSRPPMNKTSISRSAVVGVASIDGTPPRWSRSTERPAPRSAVTP